MNISAENQSHLNLEKLCFEPAYDSFNLLKYVMRLGSLLMAGWNKHLVRIEWIIIQPEQTYRCKIKYIENASLRTYIMICHYVPDISTDRLRAIFGRGSHISIIHGTAFSKQWGSKQLICVSSIKHPHWVSNTFISSMPSHIEVCCGINQCILVSKCGIAEIFVYQTISNLVRF